MRAKEEEHLRANTAHLARMREERRQQTEANVNAQQGVESQNLATASSGSALRAARS
jgi:hypothetical protein